MQISLSITYFTLLCITCCASVTWDYNLTFRIYIARGSSCKQTWLNHWNWHENCTPLLTNAKNAKQICTKRIRLNNNGTNEGYVVISIMLKFACSPTAPIYYKQKRARRCENSNRNCDAAVAVQYYPFVRPIGEWMEEAMEEARGLDRFVFVYLARIYFPNSLTKWIIIPMHAGAVSSICLLFGLESVTRGIIRH